MIISYNKKDKKINSLEETDFYDHGIMERKDIEVWIEKYPEILGEDFYIITTEHDEFNKTNERLDVMAIDRNGQLTIIELKRGSSGKYADLQAIKYAAYCSTLTFKQLVEINKDYLLKKGINENLDDIKDKIQDFITDPEFEELSGKPRIVLVASEYTPEVTATVIWLRKFELDISCVRFRPYILDNDNIVFESSVIIPLPEAKDFLIENERRTNQENLTRTQEEYQKFYAKIMEGIKDKIDLQLRQPPNKAYYQISTNITGIHFEWGFSGRPRCSFCVQIHFEKSKKEDNEKYFNEIIKLKDELEKATNEEVIGEKNWGSRWSRIYIKKEQGNINDELVKWGIEKMIMFINIINNKLY
jgi:hypothetical protein